MIEEEFVIKNNLGLHLRPVNELVSKISKYKSNIKILKNDEIADGKSVMDILTLIVSCGDKIKVIVEGEDEEQVIKEIREFFSRQQ